MTQQNTPGTASTLTPQLPDTVQLDTLLDAGLAVREPIAAIILEEDGQVVAEVAELNEFGFGDTPAEAITDLQNTIAELYRTLSAEQERLGPDLQPVWEVLRVKVERR